MGFLVDTFTNRNDMKKFVPEITPVNPVQKSEIVPMKLLFKDEKYKSKTIDILNQLYSDADLTGDHQVCTPSHTYKHVDYTDLVTIHIYCSSPPTCTCKCNRL